MVEESQITELGMMEIRMVEVSQSTRLDMMRIHVVESNYGDEYAGDSYTGDTMEAWDRMTTGAIMRRIIIYLYKACEYMSR